METTESHRVTCISASLCEYRAAKAGVGTSSPPNVEGPSNTHSRDSTWRGHVAQVVNTSTETTLTNTQIPKYAWPQAAVERDADVDSGEKHWAFQRNPCSETQNTKASLSDKLLTHNWSCVAEAQCKNGVISIKSHLECWDGWITKW